MVPYLRTMVAAAAIAVVPPFVSAALAHHVMGGELPSTAWYGLLSGVGHPIIGIDHFAFIVGVGLMSYLAGRIAVLSLLFVAGTVLGCVTHVQGLSIPFAEPAIALTVAVAAVMVGLRFRTRVGVLAAMFVVAGAFHGYAYGESIVGAENAPLAAYVIGFGVVQYCIAVGSGVAARMVVTRGYLSEAIAMRMAGGAIALVAAFAFFHVALVG